VDLGRLYQLHYGVYSAGHKVVSNEGRWLGAVLAGGEGAVLSYSSAAALWRVRAPLGGRVEITVPHATRTWKGIRRHVQVVPADELTVRDGIPVTTVPRTIFDFAASGAEVHEVASALREAEYLHLYDALSLPDLIRRYPGRRGVRTVQAALDRLRDSPTGKAASPLEERFLPFIDRFALPHPRLNATVDLGAHRPKVDCLWTEQRVVVELDGYEAHRARSAFREDRARDRRLRVGGYTVVRLTWAQLRDEPGAVALDLRTLLDQAAYKRL
jgi:hypothetical protein